MSTEDITDTTDGSQEPLNLDPSLQNKFDIKSFLKRHALLLLTFLAIVLGTGLGFALRSANMTARNIKYFLFPGELLMQILQCLVLPLIMSSIITGLATAKQKSFGKAGIYAVCYYAATSILAVFTGIVLVVLIQPGKTSSNISPPSVGKAEALRPLDASLDLIRNMFPSNMVAVCFRQYKTVYSTNKASKSINLTQTTELYDQMPVPSTVDAVNILGLIFICIAFGLTLGSMENEAKPMMDFLCCLNKAIKHLITIVIWYSPVGIIFLVAGQILKLKSMSVLGYPLGMYTVTVIAGLAIHSLITLPLSYLILTQKNPLTFMAGLLQALITAFGTSSSAVTVPISIQCLENNLNMEKHVTRVVLPIAATLTLTGTALYEAVAAIFVAQIHNVDLSGAQVIIISVTAAAAATGGAGIPQGGMATMALVMTSLGLPADGMTYIIAVDWILDRIRTTVNVLGDCFGVGVVHHLSRKAFQNSRTTEESFGQVKEVVASDCETVPHPMMK